MKRTTALMAATALAALASGAARAETWDMPMAYPATNYHTENGVAFAPSLSNQSMLSDLGDDYLTCGPDPRASTFSMTYVGATC